MLERFLYLFNIYKNSKECKRNAKKNHLPLIPKLYIAQASKRNAPEDQKPFGLNVSLIVSCFKFRWLRSFKDNENLKNNINKIPARQTGLKFQPGLKFAM